MLVFHGVEGIGYEAIPTETLRAYYDYIKDHESRMWSAKFLDGAKYARERMSRKVESRRSGDAITGTVTHSLDPRLYDEPLTAKTAVPADWQVVRFRQGDDARWLAVHREDGVTSVVYRMMPNGKPVTLEKGRN